MKMTRADALRYRKHIETAVQGLGADVALEVKSLYPAWRENVAYAVGFRVTRNDRLYECLNAHTSQSDWTPEVTPSLWAMFDESHAGTLEDPIPYEGNMALENGKYYIQDGVVYQCVRDTVNPVYHALKDLLGLYLILA